jgi:prephenate dehydratase
VVHADTAGACRMAAERKDPTIAAIGSRLAAEIYGLRILKEDIEDFPNNITRFLLMARERIVPHRKEGPVITTFVFEVRSVPAALYKALGGFATNGVNLTKLESYMKGGVFEQVEFYVDIEGHPDDEPVRHAFEELRFFSTRLKLLGTYPQHPMRAASKSGR